MDTIWYDIIHRHSIIHNYTYTLAGVTIGISREFIMVYLSVSFNMASCGILVNMDDLKNHRLWSLPALAKPWFIRLLHKITDTLRFHQTWLAGKSAMNGVFNRKISYKWFSSQPCLMIGGLCLARPAVCKYRLGNAAESLRDFSGWLLFIYPKKTSWSPRLGKPRIS